LFGDGTAAMIERNNGFVEKLKKEKRKNLGERLSIHCILYEIWCVKDSEN
jgi:hypothetical protein